MGVELVPWLTESVAKCIDNYILSDNRLSQGEILNRLHTVQLLNSPDKPVFLQLVERDQLLLSDSCVKIRANFARKCQLPEGTIISLHQAKLSIDLKPVTVKAKSRYTLSLLIAHFSPISDTAGTSNVGSPVPISEEPSLQPVLLRLQSITSPMENRTMRTSPPPNSQVMYSQATGANTVYDQTAAEEKRDVNADLATQMVYDNISHTTKQNPMTSRVHVTERLNDDALFKLLKKPNKTTNDDTLFQLLRKPSKAPDVEKYVKPPAVPTPDSLKFPKVPEQTSIKTLESTSRWVAVNSPGQSHAKSVPVLMSQQSRSKRRNEDDLSRNAPLLLPTSQPDSIPAPSLKPDKDKSVEAKGSDTDAPLLSRPVSVSSSSPSKNPSFYYCLGHSKRIPRHYVKIPADQQKILDSTDSIWVSEEMSAKRAVLPRQTEESILAHRSAIAEESSTQKMPKDIRYASATIEDDAISLLSWTSSHISVVAGSSDDEYQHERQPTVDVHTVVVENLHESLDGSNEPDHMSTVSSNEEEAIPWSDSESARSKTPTPAGVVTNMRENPTRALDPEPASSMPDELEFVELRPSETRERPESHLAFQQTLPSSGVDESTMLQVGQSSGTHKSSYSGRMEQDDPNDDWTSTPTKLRRHDRVASTSLSDALGKSDVLDEASSPAQEIEEQQSRNLEIKTQLTNNPSHGGNLLSTATEESAILPASPVISSRETDGSNKTDVPTTHITKPEISAVKDALSFAKNHSFVEGVFYEDSQMEAQGSLQSPSSVSNDVLVTTVVHEPIQDISSLTEERADMQSQVDLHSDSTHKNTGTHGSQIDTNSTLSSAQFIPNTLYSGDGTYDQDDDDGGDEVEGAMHNSSDIQVAASSYESHPNAMIDKSINTEYEAEDMEMDEQPLQTTVQSDEQVRTLQVETPQNDFALAISHYIVVDDSPVRMQDRVQDSMNPKRLATRSRTPDSPRKRRRITELVNLESNASHVSSSSDGVDESRLIAKVSTSQLSPQSRIAVTSSVSEHGNNDLTTSSMSADKPVVKDTDTSDQTSEANMILPKTSAVAEQGLLPSSLSDNDMVEKFMLTYEGYKGTPKSIVKISAYIKCLAERQMEPSEYLWDDFIRVFSAEYVPFEIERQKNGGKEVDFVDFYKQRSDEPQFSSNIINAVTIDRVIEQQEKLATGFVSAFREHLSSRYGNIPVKPLNRTATDLERGKTYKPRQSILPIQPGRGDEEENDSSNLTEQYTPTKVSRRSRNVPWLKRKDDLSPSATVPATDRSRRERLLFSPTVTSQPAYKDAPAPATPTIATPETSRISIHEFRSPPLPHTASRTFASSRNNNVSPLKKQDLIMETVRGTTSPILGESPSKPTIGKSVLSHMTSVPSSPVQAPRFENHDAGEESEMSNAIKRSRRRTVHAIGNTNFSTPEFGERAREKVNTTMSEPKRRGILESLRNKVREKPDMTYEEWLSSGGHVLC